MEDYSSLSFPSSSSDSLTGMDDIEAGFFGCSSAAAAFKPFRRRGTYRDLSLPSLTTFFTKFPDDEPHHFLDSCFLCSKSLAGNGDIFMYRGDTPFCSEKCRMEQIEMDEEKERRWKIYGKKEQQNKNLKKASSSSKSRAIHFRAGAVVAS